jgi:hypothetical protein
MENVHPQTKMSLLARQVVADLLAAHDATHPVQAKRSLELAVGGALEFERVRVEMGHDSGGKHAETI